MADKSIGTLPKSAGLYDDSLFVSEHSGTAESVTGKQFKDFAKKGVEVYVQSAQKAAQDAIASANTASSAIASTSANKEAAIAARSAAELAKHGAVEARDSANSYSVQSLKSAAEAQSWAVGGTSTRPGEDTNNSKYYANRAQAEADRATVPAVKGLYNVILQDRITGERYALLVEDGVLCLLGVRNTLDAINLTLVDTVAGQAYTLAVESGVLILEEAP